MIIMIQLRYFFFPKSNPRRDLSSNTIPSRLVCIQVDPTRDLDVTAHACFVKSASEHKETCTHILFQICIYIIFVSLALFIYIYIICYIIYNSQIGSCLLDLGMINLEG